MSALPPKADTQRACSKSPLSAKCRHSDRRQLIAPLGQPAYAGLSDALLPATQSFTFAWSDAGVLDACQSFSTIERVLIGEVASHPISPRSAASSTRP